MRPQVYYEQSLPEVRETSLFRSHVGLCVGTALADSANCKDNHRKLNRASSFDSDSCVTGYVDDLE